MSFFHHVTLFFAFHRGLLFLSHVNGWHLLTDHVESRIQALSSLDPWGAGHGAFMWNTAALSCASPHSLVKNKKFSWTFPFLCGLAVNAGIPSPVCCHQGPFPWLPRFQALAQGPPQSIPPCLLGRGDTFLLTAEGRGTGGALLCAAPPPSRVTCVLGGSVQH